MVCSRRRLALLLAATLLAAAATGPATGQEAEAPPPATGEAPTPAPAKPRPGRDASINLKTVVAVVSNPTLWPLLACSVVTLGFTLERLVALRRRRVIPREFTQRFLERLAAGKLDRERAIEMCRSQESPMARVFGHAVRYWGEPAGVIRQAVGLDAGAELADLKRNVRVLSGMATLAPLLGLLGTVIGLIQSFDALGSGKVAAAAKSEALAYGISLALTATAAGLVVAAFAVTAYYYLLHRIDALVRELDDQATKAIEFLAADGARLPLDRRGPYPADLSRHSRSEAL